MAITNSFSGRGTGVVLPSNEGVLRSQENMNNLFLQAEKLRYEAFKKNEDEFIKASAIDPVSSISNAATEYQSKLIDSFNKKWASEMKTSAGNLSTDQKIQMMKDRRFIESEGSKIQTMQKAWEQEDAMVKKNPLDFDEEEHALKTQQFMQTGDFDYNDIPWKARPISEDLIKMRGRIGEEREEEFVPDKKYPYLVTRGKVTGSKEEIAPIIRDRVLSDPRTQKHMLQEWSKLPLEEKNKYLDINGDGKVSQEEAQSKNPIIEWYVDTNYEKAVGRKVGELRDIRRGGGSGGNYRKILVGGRQVSYEPTEAREVPIDNTVFKKYHEYQGLPSMNFSVATGNNVEVLSNGMMTSINNPTQFTGVPLGYDEDSDKVVFLLTKDFADIGISGLEGGTNVKVAIPRTALDKGFFSDKLEIKKDGKIIPIGSAVQSNPSTPPQTTTQTPKKKKFNPVTGQFE